jgi:hypothetical protein
MLGLCCPEEDLSRMSISHILLAGRACEEDAGVIVPWGWRCLREWYGGGTKEHCVEISTQSRT